MKIYTTTTTERKTVTQGANKYLHTDIKIGSAKDSRRVTTVKVVYSKEIDEYQIIFTEFVQSKSGEDVAHITLKG